MRRFLAAAVVIGVAGCGASASVPYPNGPWSAGDQGSFIGACDAGASDGYCRCALGAVMQQYPDTSQLPGSIVTGGTTAAEHQSDFPDCAAK